jgi:hypothetical protein
LPSRTGVFVHKADGSFDVVFDEEPVPRSGEEGVIAVDIKIIQGQDDNDDDDWYKAEYCDFSARVSIA